MSDEETRDWLQAGKRAAVVTAGWHSSVKFRRIEKVGKRDIVLADGSRWSAAHLGRSGDRYGGQKLDDPDSPRVLELLRDQQARELRNQARILLGKVDKKLAHNYGEGDTQQILAEELVEPLTKLFPFLLDRVTKPEES